MPSTISPDIWTKTYTSFGGCDIVALIEDTIVGNLQGVSYSITREKGPIYVMGRADPVSFSRGKRGIAGSLVFTNFDRAALFDIIDKPYGIDFSYYKKTFDLPAAGRSVELERSNIGQLTTKHRANYPDQVPPFNITITAANEYGQSMMMGIYGVELLNQGQGISVDDMVTETQFTFVCRGVVDWQPRKDFEYGRSSLESKMRGTQAFESAEKAYSLS